MATRTIADGGGNWNVAGTWVEGIVPTAADEVVATATSGNLTNTTALAVCRSIDLNGYTGVFTSNYLITIGDGTAPTGGIALRVVADVAGGTGIFKFVSSAAGTQQIISNGKYLPRIDVYVTNGILQFADDFECNTIVAVSGTLDFNDKTINCHQFTTSGASALTLDFGSSLILLTVAANAISHANSNTTISANTATFRYEAGNTTFTWVDGTDWNGASLYIIGNGTITFNNSGTWDSLILMPDAARTITTTAGKTITIDNKFYCYPIGGQITFVTGTISVSSGTVKMYQVAACSTLFTGGATFNLMNNCDVSVADAATYGLTIVGGKNYINLYDGSDSLFNAYGFYKVAYTNATGVCPVIDEVVDGETSSSSAKVSYINEYEWSLGSGTMYFSYKSAAFVAETCHGNTGDGHFDIAADFVNGAWLTTNSGATAARIAKNDRQLICKTPPPSSIGNATWTDQSKTVTLATAQTINIDMCETAWTAAVGGDCTVTRTGVATDAKEGSYCMKHALDAAVQANIMQAYYATGALDLSTKQKISFWIKNSGAIVANNWLIALCSDAAGAVPVDMFRVTAIPSINQWSAQTLEREYSVDFTGGSGSAPAAGTTVTGATSLSTAVVIRSTLSSGTWAGGDAAGRMFVHTRSAAFQAEQVDQGGNHFHIAGDFTRGNLGSSINSIAVYSGNTTTGMASKYIYVDNFIACTSSGLNLQSLISKNSAEQGGNEGWYGIQSINGTTVILDTYTNCKANEGNGYSTNGTTPDTVTTYSRETFKTSIASTVSADVQACTNSGVTTELVSYEGGFDLTTGLQSGETFFDGSNGFGNGFTTNARVSIKFDMLCFVRYNVGIEFESTCTNGVIGTIDFSSNCNVAIWIVANSTPVTKIGFINNCRDECLLLAASFTVIDEMYAANNCYYSSSNAYGISITGNCNVITLLEMANNNLIAGVYITGFNNEITEVGTLNDNDDDGILISACANNRILSVDNIDGNDYGIYLTYAVDNVIDNVTNMTGCITSAIVCTNFSTGNKIRVATCSGGAVGMNVSHGINYLIDSTLSHGTEFSFDYAYADAWVYSMNHDNTAGNYCMFGHHVDVNWQTGTKHGTEAGSWKTAIKGSSRTTVYPVKLKMREIAVSAGTLVTVKAWVKKDHATNVACRLVHYGSHPIGTTEQYDTKANDTDWEELTITFTPTAEGVAEIYLETWYVSGNSNTYCGGITPSQA